MLFEVLAETFNPNPKNRTLHILFTDRTIQEEEYEQIDSDTAIQLMRLATRIDIHNKDGFKANIDDSILIISKDYIYYCGDIA